ncbi:MAG: glycerol-3-phosphate dehydrogenase [Hyphomicrobiaceae bacterium]|nr:glycerol-3-phosphate dehydrogenase [Hyphomicrobiaceae bacterium]
MGDSGADATIFDLAVVGGGINGCGIAADAAGRGLKVLLVEQGDLAAGTSSASSKLIHGGLRYLEHYEFRLVKESLEEREILLANAPHIVWPLRFVVPHVPEMRSRMLIRAGLFLYDHLARRRRIPASTILDLARDPTGHALSTRFKNGFSYWDCWVDDARLVVLVAKLAEKHGASILTRTSLRSAIAGERYWQLTLANGAGTRTVAAHVLVNAAGPWAGEVARNAIQRHNASVEVPVRLVKGSHIVVPRIAGADSAFLLQAEDRRVVFLLPFADRFTLIGTTDVPFTGDPSRCEISHDEEQYLLQVANGFLATPLKSDDIVWRYSGVRPLYDDASDNPSVVTRDYRLELDASGGGPPLLTVVGGKVTTYRRLAEQAMQLIGPLMPQPLGPAWTATAVLPGGDMPDADFDAYTDAFLACYPHIPVPLLMPLLRRYGTMAAEVLGDARTVADLGEDLGGGLSLREVLYLRNSEWAVTPQDILWRRTKAGLHVMAVQLAQVEARLEKALATGT